MITRRIGKLLRGSATPSQMMLACLLGSALGFMPGFGQAAGLIVVLTLALIILNANLALAAMVGVVAKIVSLMLLPVSFAVGRLLLDGPTQPLAKTLINMPVLALFGLEYYVTSGGLVVGLLIGLGLGMLAIKTVQVFRAKLAALEEGSEVYQRWMAKWWIKLLVFVFVGRGPKESYAALLEKKGKVVRPIGVVFSVLVVVLLVVMQMFFAGPFVTTALQRGLERANGATVDLEDADLDLAAGRLTVTGLAMADPNALDTDLLRAATIEADVSATDLLRKRLKLDRVVISDAVHGAKRTTPGRLVGRPPAAPTTVATKEGEKTLDHYLQKPKQWKNRLTQVRRWLEKLSGPSEKAEAADDKTKGESRRERLAREIQSHGYARVAAGHLIEGAPRLTVTELLAEKVRTDALEGETIDVNARNISTHPYLLSETPSVAIKSSGQTLELGLELGAVSAGRGQNSVDFAYRGLPIDSIADDLSTAGTRPISGGTMDVALQGTIRTTGGTYIDMPLQVTLHRTTVTVAGAGSAPVEKLTIPLGLRGPIDRPRIRIDDSQLADALVKAGAGALAGEVRGRADKLLKEAVSDVDLKEGLPKIDLKKALGGVGDSDDAANKNDNDNKSTDDLRDAARDLTKGLFGGKKKDKKP